MSKPRVFISHSTKHDGARQFRDHLVSALRADGFRVLLDEEVLELGGRWERKLNLWLETCDAAVILLSRAALESRYVAHEASILSHRAEMTNDRFRFVPVLFDGITEKELGGSWLRPARLQEIQGIVNGGSDRVRVRKAVEWLRSHVAEETPGERHAQRLADLLAPIDDTELKVAIKAAAVDCAEIAQARTLAHEAALSLRAASIDAAATALRKVRVFLKCPGRDDVGGLELALWYVACGSVTSKAQATITDEINAVCKASVATMASPPSAEDAAPIRVLALRADVDRTAELFVSCACDVTPIDGWPVVVVDGSAAACLRGDDQPLDALGRVILASLASKLCCADATESCVMNEVRRIVRYGDGVVVALRMAKSDLGTLASLRQRFPSITFMLLVGSAKVDPTREASGALSWVEPALDEAEERGLWAECDRAVSDLTGADRLESPWRPVRSPRPAKGSAA